MIRSRSPLRRYLAIAAAVLALATSNLVAQALMPVLTAQKQSQPHKRPDESNPFHVQFRDVTRESGIHFHHERAQSPQRLYPETMGAGVAWIDYDQDGYLDAFFVNSGYTPNFHPAEPPQPALYHNNGDGTFTDVTAAAGVGNDGNWGTAAGWFDYDHDGKLDLLVTNYVQYDVDHPIVCGDWRPGRHELPQVSAYCHPDNFPGTSPRLYHNNGDGTFTDVTAKAGLVNKDGKSLGVVLADLNNDGWPDIFIANDTQRNFLYFNNGDGTFRDASFTSGAGFSEDGRPEAGMSADAADITNNSLPYLFVSHLDFELNRLYRNNGDGTFTDYTIASGVGQSSILNSAFGARFFDFDNDGWRDLLIVNGHILDNIKLYHPEVAYEEEKKLYRNTGQGRFVDSTKSQGADFRAPRVGRGLAVGDYDNDGWQDFLVSNNGEDAQLFHNDSGVAAGRDVSGAANSKKPPSSGEQREPRHLASPQRSDSSPSIDDRRRGTGHTDAAGTAGGGDSLGSPSDQRSSGGVMDLRKGKDKTISFDADEPAAQKNHWLAIRLIGTKSNRDGIGAHLKLVAGDLTSYDQSKGGMSYCSGQDPRIFFGLGSHARVDSLEIWWPSGLRESVTNLPVDVFLTIEEGSGKGQARRYPSRRK